MTESLIQKRQAIQHLLNERSTKDAMISYYALYHPPDKTNLILHRDGNGLVDGFITLCRTGMDLFRPLVTMRAENQEVAAELIEMAIPPESAVLFDVSANFRSVMEAFFTTSGEVVTQTYQLNVGVFSPVINILVTRAPTPGGDPRFVVRGQSFDRGARATGPALATAGINWRSPHFADVYVFTDPAARGRNLGKSVVSAVTTWLLEKNITPLYSTAKENTESNRLAQSLGYQQTGILTFVGEGIRRATF